jgi:hypothetical protein
MEFIPVPNGIMAEMRYSYLGVPAENVFWFYDTANPTPPIASLEAVAGGLFDWWDTNIKTIQSANATLNEIYVTDQSSASGGAYSYSAGMPVDGANVQEPLPGNVTLCISLRTSQRGRSFRGRSYIIGLTENQVSGNLVTSASAAAWLGAYDALVNTFNTGPFVLSVCSRFANKLPRAAGVLTPIRDAVLVNNRVDSQRGRLN